MPTHYMNCLYIHGLHSNVNEDKVGIMTKYFTKVTAKHFIYGETPNVYDLLKEMCLSEQVDFIMGSSFGGYLGFYLSRELQLPALLFNPAFFYAAQDDTFIVEPSEASSPFTLIVSGEQDDVIPAGSIEKFLRDTPETDHVRMVHCDWLGHQIDLATFESMTSAAVVLARAAAPTS